jgi:pseudouridine-5'-phosphate glycosidase
VDDATAAAAIARVRLEQGGGMVVALPIAERLALDPREAERSVAAAEAEAARLGVGGGDVTPFLLGEIAERDARVVRANVELLAANARFAGALAREMIERA